MAMGLGMYKKSLLLLTNTSEDVIIKSKARELFLHYKTYKVCQNKQNSRKPLYSGVLPKLSVIWRFHCILKDKAYCYVCREV